ncbi:cyclophilin peptidyl-prolyl cis-trans isomerase Cyp8 [Lecanora helva]
MGKGTDKLYITHSEWASEDAYSASAGSGIAKSKAPDATFKRLPFNFCAVSLQPFETPACTADGTVFDIDNILPWLLEHGTNPVNGNTLKADDLIRLHFAKNDDGEMVDPVTFKVFTDNTHLVALKNTGNVFAYDTVERLNIKAKMWRDLVSDDEFSRKDIITLQDPQNVQSRNLSSFKYIKEGTSTLSDEQRRERDASVNKPALGNAASVLKTKDSPATSKTPQVGKYLHQATSKPSPTSLTKKTSANSAPKHSPSPAHTSKQTPYNAAQHTTGRAAASFTSTGLTPHTSAALALLSDEEYMLKARRVKHPGYARITTTHGPLSLELLPEHAPKAVWNFIQLAKKGYYKDVIFHRNIRNFMLQGGDPTGTGRGGTSCWGKNFEDEFEGPRSHDARGVVSMANKGKNTNSSQFFITYRPCPHLDRKHTIFARVVEGMDTLTLIENVDVDEGKRPLEEVRIEEVTVLIDPFEEFLKRKEEKDRAAEVEEEVRKAGGREDDRTTWTGKRIRSDGVVEGDAAAAGVGKYLDTMNYAKNGDGDVLEEWEREEQPVRKKMKGVGGFGNFDNW